MSYKDEIKVKLSSMLDSASKVSDGVIRQLLHEYYVASLKEAEITGQSIVSINYEILEGIEEAYHNKPNEVEEVLLHASVLMSSVLYEDSRKKIIEKERKLELAKDELQNTVRMEIWHLLESVETIEHYAQDNSHEQLEISMAKIKTDILQTMKTFNPNSTQQTYK